MIFERMTNLFTGNIKRFLLLGVLVTFGSGFYHGVQAADNNFDWEILHLNAQQAQLINQVEAQWKTTAGQIIPQIESDKSELRQLLNSPSPDQPRVSELQNRISANKTKLHTAAMQSFLKKKEFLDDKQKEQLQHILGSSMR